MCSPNFIILVSDSRERSGYISNFNIEEAGLCPLLSILLDEEMSRSFSIGPLKIYFQTSLYFVSVPKRVMTHYRALPFD